MKVTSGYPIFITNDKDTKKDVKNAIDNADDFFEAQGVEDAIDTPPTEDDDDFYGAEGDSDTSIVEDEFFDADGEDHSEFLDYFSKENREARKSERQAKKDAKSGSAPSAGAAAPAGATPAEKKKFDLDKTLGQAKQGADLFGTVKGLFGKGGAQTTPDVVGGGGGYVPPAPEPKGMSTGAKIGIAVGAVALVGIIIFAVTRKKGASAGK